MDTFVYILNMLLFSFYSIVFFTNYADFRRLRFKLNIFIPSLFAMNVILYLATSHFLYPIQIFFCFLVALFITLFFHTNTNQQRIFAASLYTFIIVCAQSVTYSVFMLFSKDNFYTLFQNEDTTFKLLTTVSYTLAIVLFTIFIKSFPKNKIKNSINSKHARNLISPASTILLLIATVSTCIYYVDAISNTIPAYHLALTCMLLFSYASLFFYLMHLEKTYVIQSKNEVLQNQLATQRTYYKKNMDYIIALRKIKHDYFNLLHSFEYSLINYSREELEKLVLSLQQKTRVIEEEFTQYANDPLIDSIILDANELCNAKQIKLNALVSIPDNLPFSKDELCFIFATLLNSLITIAEHTDSAKRSIAVTNKIRPNWFIIRCEVYSESTLEKLDALLIDTDFDIVRNMIGEHNGFVETNKKESLYNIQICISK